MEHRIQVETSKTNRGIAAHSLLNAPILKYPQFRCPACGTLIDIAPSIEQDIQKIVADNGNDQVLLRFSIFHIE